MSTIFSSMEKRWSGRRAAAGCCDGSPMRGVSTPPRSTSIFHHSSTTGFSMASSTSTDPSPTAPALPVPRTVELTTIAEQIAAIDELVTLARHRIRVFDRDLSQTGWNQPTRVDRLGAFLRGVRGRRFDVIVHDATYLETACPRMLHLLRAY